MAAARVRSCRENSRTTLVYLNAFFFCKIIFFFLVKSCKIFRNINKIGLEKYILFLIE